MAFSGVRQPSTKSTLHPWASLQVINLLVYGLNSTASTHASKGVHA